MCSDVLNMLGIFEVNCVCGVVCFDVYVCDGVM